MIKILISMSKVTLIIALISYYVLPMTLYNCIALHQFCSYLLESRIYFTVHSGFIIKVTTLQVFVLSLL